MVSRPTSSVKTSYGAQVPVIGSAQSAWNSWPKAFARVSASVKKPTATNQCATPTMPQRFMRVWPRNSLTAVTVRRWGHWCGCRR